MPHYKYLIVGGGMTADAATQGIRKTDAEGAIGMIGAESHPPYDRPPLSKKLWQGKPVESIWRGMAERNVELHLGRKVESLDPQNRRVVDDAGAAYTYDKLLLATGGAPRRLPFGDDQVIYYRTFDDYQQLRSLVEQGGRFAVIGGGFIGSEIAAALAMNGQQATMIFLEEGIGGRLFPAELARFLNDYYREKGVEVHAGESVASLEMRGKQHVVKTQSGREIVADHIIAGLGIEPNTALARQAGLEVDNGILVDESLRTSEKNIYAAGDVANFYNPTLAMRLRVEHEDNANTMGKMAGRAMAGEPVTYDYLPFFYSDLFDLGYEAVGDLNPQLEIFADWQELFRQGVIYYLKQGRVRGVILWNVWDQVETARQLIAEPGPFRAQELKGRIPTG
jgi:NADPH-dependent 2,4-dienoyl-CoA reductase/sulfur reductase-like enzyme